MKFPKKIFIILFFSCILLVTSIYLPRAINKDHKELSYNSKKIISEDSITNNTEQANTSETKAIQTESVITNTTKQQVNVTEVKNDIKNINDPEKETIEKETAEIEKETIEEETTEEETVKTAYKGKEVNNTWIQSQIDENRDYIDEGDLNVGSNIYSKIDMGYIFSLTKDGMTDEERVQMRDHLLSNLSPSEYNIAKNLFNKYIGMVK